MKIDKPFQTKYKNIIFIGMPGAGKTTISQLLSEATGWVFTDTDTLLEQRCESTLQALIDDKSHDDFCRIEEDLLLSLHFENHIIATGGSVVYGGAAMKHLQDLGLVIYLQLPLNELEKRLSNYSSRGIANPSGLEFVDVFAERVPLYERYANVTIACENQSAKQIVQTIMTKI